MGIFYLFFKMYNLVKKDFQQLHFQLKVSNNDVT